MSEGGRVVPQALEAERGLVGSMIMNPDYTVPKVLDSGLKSEAFYDRRCGAVMEVMESMVRASEPIDAITVAKRCEDAGVMQQVGGWDGLNNMTDNVGVAAHVEFYATEIMRSHKLRQIINAATDVVAAAYQTDADPLSVLQQVPSQFTPLMDSTRRDLTNQEVLDGWYQRLVAIKNGEITNGLPLPWKVMDVMTGGLEPGLHIIGARPSAGKTTLEVNIADYLARDGVHVARACLDMHREALLSRSVIREARVSLPKLKAGYARWSQLETVRQCKDLVAQWPMHIIEDRTLEGIVAHARALKLKYDIQLLTVDFVQLVRCEKNKFDRRLEIGEISGGLKALGFELDIPVLLLSQLGRQSERDNRMPKLSDLRESGDLEQDGTNIWLLSKPALNDDRTLKDFPDAGMLPEDVERRYLRPVLFDLAKQQNGEIGVICMYMVPNYFGFIPAEPGFVDMQARIQEYELKASKDEFADEEPVVEDDPPEEEQVELEV